jgi:hypothetical protein
MTNLDLVSGMKRLRRKIDDPVGRPALDFANYLVGYLGRLIAGADNTDHPRRPADEMIFSFYIKGREEVTWEERSDGMNWFARLAARSPQKGQKRFVNARFQHSAHRGFFILFGSDEVPSMGSGEQTRKAPYEPSASTLPPSCPGIND